MSLKQIIQSKIAAAEAHVIIFSRHVSTLDIPNGDALRAAFIPGATWKNLALVGITAKMAGAGRVVAYRGSGITTYGSSGGFDSDVLSSMPSAHGAAISYGIDAAGYRGVPFTDEIDLDLWESPLVVRKETLVAATGSVQLALQNDSGAAKGYTLALKMVAWQ